MLKKTIRRLGALAMVLAMAVSVFAVNASAAEAEIDPAIKDVVIKKAVTVNENTNLPNGTFTFALEATSKTYHNSQYSAANVTAGAVTLTDNQIESSPNATVVSGFLSETATIRIDASKFAQPGTYKWKVTETGTYADGANCATQVKYLIVNIIRNDAGTLEVESAGLVPALDDTEGQEKQDHFTNVYDSVKLDMSKAVNGKMGDKSKFFNFKVIIESSDSNKSYNIVNANNQNATVSGPEKTVVEGGKTQYKYTVTMKDTGALTIYGLAGNDTWTVEETDTDSAYSTTVNGTAGKSASGNASKNGEAAFVNTATSSPVTGVIMTIAPYALMVVLAGAFAVVFLTRRNRAE